MRHIGSVLWLVPFAAHIGYILATYEHLPPQIGSFSGDTATDRTVLLVEWFAIIGMANMIFSFIHVRLPRFGDRMLTVPGKKYWLADEERRAELVDRLRGVCEAALLGLNIFFLAIYQSIYQTNAWRPILFLPMSALVFFFMVVPLLVSIVAILSTMRSFASKARQA